MPDVAPPGRVRQPEAPSDEVLAAAGLSPRFVRGGGEALKRLLLGAALALRQGRTSDAVVLQQRACELCAEMDMPREQVLNITILGGYLLAAGGRAPARQAYVRARDLAVASRFDDLVAQTELALGMLAAVERQPAAAAGHYAMAGRHAEMAGVAPLAIESWRMAGQLALDAGSEPGAIDCWNRALALAEPLDPGLAKVTSAADVARALAAVCRRRGLAAQAGSLEQKAAEWESRTVAEAVPTASPSLNGRS